MPENDPKLAIKLIEQVRSEFDRLRWQSGRVKAFLIHKATNAEAEGVRGVPHSFNSMIAMGSAGHRDPRQIFDKNGSPVFRDDPIVDVHGNPITNSAGEAFDFVMPAFRTVEFSGDSSG